MLSSKSMGEKFSKQDRELLVKELEKIQKTTLSPAKPSRKFFKDEEGKYYCIFGGKDTWHAISDDLIQQLETTCENTLLVIAKKYRTRIDICAASAAKLVLNKERLPVRQNGYQFHVVLTEDGMYVLEIPELYLKKIGEIVYAAQAPSKYDSEEVKKFINMELHPDPSTLESTSKEELTHSDIQAKIIIVGNLLGYRTFTPDRGRSSRYGKLGDLCSETEIPSDYIPPRQLNTVRSIDVIWFDPDGLPTHCFEVEHTTDITKGLLRLYQIRKLRTKMIIVADESSKTKFNVELTKDPFHQIKGDYTFRTYSELNEFFESVKQFTLLKGAFLNESEGR